MDDVRALDIGFIPNAGSPSPALYSSEHSTLLLFSGQPTNRPYERHQILVEVTGCIISSFGYPNDEALPGHPLYPGLGNYNVFEVLEPSWRDRIIEQTRVSFPRIPPHYARLRHFVITFQDSTFECLAQDLRARRVSGTPAAILRPYIERS